LQRHKRGVHSDSKQLCPHCGKLFRSKTHLSRHAHVHTDAKPYSCRHCSDCFRTTDQLKRHLLRSHNEGTWFTCDVCKKKFSGKPDLERHVPRHEDAAVKPYVCSECPKRFYTAHELRRHHPVHSELKKFSCDLCDRLFKRKVNFRLHYKKCSAKLVSSDVCL